MLQRSLMPPFLGSSVKMETLCSSETLVAIDQPAWCNVPKNWRLTQDRVMCSYCISYNYCPCNLNFQGKVECDLIVHLLTDSHTYHYSFVHISEEVYMKYVVNKYVNKICLISAWSSDWNFIAQFCSASSDCMKPSDIAS